MPRYCIQVIQRNRDVFRTLRYINFRHLSIATPVQTSRGLSATTNSLVVKTVEKIDRKHCCC